VGGVDACRCMGVAESVPGEGDVWCLAERGSGLIGKCHCAFREDFASHRKTSCLCCRTASRKSTRLDDAGTGLVIVGKPSCDDGGDHHFCNISNVFKEASAAQP